MQGVALLFALVLLLTLTMVVPTLRVWRRHGTWPVVFRRDANPLQRLMGALTGALFLGVLAWAALFALLGPEPLDVYRSVPRGIAAAGWVIMGLGTLLVIAAQVQMGASWRIGIDDRPTELVTAGLFGLARNPIFSGLLLALFGVVLITPAPWTVMGFAMACAFIALQVRLEEQHLAGLHGRSYQQYAARVGRFLPLLGRLVTEKTVRC